MSSNKDIKSKNNYGIEVVYSDKNSSISTINDNYTSTVTSVPPNVILNNNNLLVNSLPHMPSKESLNNKNKSSSRILQKNSIISDKDNSTSSITLESNGNKDLYSGTPDQKLKNFDGFDQILKNRVETIEKNLLDKQKLALGSLDTNLKAALVDINGHKVETKDELKETRNSVLGTIALFAAFFTFVSVNVNIFTKAENVQQSIIFMLSFWLCIIGFISLFFLFLNKGKTTSIWKSIEFYSTFGCIISSCVLMYLLFNKSDNESYSKLNSSLISIQNENKKLREDNDALNKKIISKFESLDEQVMELRKNQYQLNQSK